MSSEGGDDTERIQENGSSKRAKESFERIAKSILDLSSSIIDCHIASEVDGAVLADVVRTELKGQVDGFSQTGSGMGPTWGIVIINMLRRLDKERSKLNYVIVGREQYNALFFPASKDAEDLVIGILLQKTAEPAKIYDKVMKIFNSS